MSGTFRIGDRVRCWPGARSGRSYVATVIAGPGRFGGGQVCVRVRADDGRSDYIALTHVSSEAVPGSSPNA